MRWPALLPADTTSAPQTSAPPPLRAGPRPAPAAPPAGESSGEFASMRVQDMMGQYYSEWY